MINLSASKLSLYSECKCCFWLANNKKIDRPRGIFPSLPGGMDRVLKSWYDIFRPEFPPEVVGRIDGKLFSDTLRLEKWRNWRSGLSCIVDKRVKVIGAIDDVIVRECESAEGGLLYCPFDYKTRGTEPKDDGSQYYGNQLDIYSLLLSANGLNVAGKGYLVYYWPFGLHDYDLVNDITSINFKCQVFSLSVDSDRATEFILKAADCLEGPEPKQNPGCGYCSYNRSIFYHYLSDKTTNKTEVET